MSNYHNKKNKGYKGKQSQYESPITRDDHKKLLLLHESGDNDLINKIKKFVEDNYGDISTSQLRNIYSQVKKAKLQELPLMRPKLAYIAGRTNTSEKGMHRLINLLDELIQKVGVGSDEDEKKKKLVGFKTFFESVLAYHKYYEKTKGKVK